MPSTKPSSHVLVTGASGYIASWTCQFLLEGGFKVRGTVRSKEKGDHLSQIFERFGNKWSYVVIEDIEKPNGFDEAVKDIDSVAHIASPCHMNVTDDPYKYVINPAVIGTLSILNSANGPNGKSVKRIVITSSLAAVLNPTNDLNHVFNESEWNEYSSEVVKAKGKDSPPVEIYRCSKTAEKAAWSFMKENQPAFDLVTLCPSYVLGPVIHQVKDSKSINGSVKLFYNYLVGISDAESAKKPFSSEVDVRDLAVAHIQALVIEKAGGNRYAISKRWLDPDHVLCLTCGGSKNFNALAFTWQDALDILHEKGQGKDWPNSTKGEPGSGKSAKQNLYDASKSINDLDMKYRPFEETIIDMSNSLKALSKTWRYVFFKPTRARIRKSLVKEQHQFEHKTVHINEIVQDGFQGNGIDQKIGNEINR
ncbi:uncharacterized protein MELLADRAFT_113972 [Melampsora larici-populina 98AG31]|uniref:NAD-dependent epimerase/dehydratase domain-containing protein n=1 Tax=Melampsora larici-populina (strain 98AG31 / pathotype 3-4-7) TaxID=747676 RepID=F4SBQ0_MELLP|nr:uncharacterized protein MELLADRAFT_113972 [Melampsora larici-populina 98AG31]EGF97903.1 hypothetical protein MELLADRAFT_113972 [Melampsora larici-populina 98AG31]